MRPRAAKCVREFRKYGLESTLPDHHLLGDHQHIGYQFNGLHQYRSPPHYHAFNVLMGPHQYLMAIQWASINILIGGPILRFLECLIFAWVPPAPERRRVGKATMAWWTRAPNCTQTSTSSGYVSDADSTCVRVFSHWISTAAAPCDKLTHYQGTPPRLICSTASNYLCCSKCSLSCDDHHDFGSGTQHDERLPSPRCSFPPCGYSTFTA
jgi:hypothetical protein